MFHSQLIENSRDYKKVIYGIGKIKTKDLMNFYKSTKLYFTLSSETRKKRLPKSSSLLNIFIYSYVISFSLLDST